MEFTKLELVEQMLLLKKRDLYFSCPGKKSTKRIRHRGGADREVYRYYLSLPPLRSQLRAALPYVPLPALVERLVIVDL